VFHAIILMDIPARNTLSDPYAEGAASSYPLCAALQNRMALRTNRPQVAVEAGALSSRNTELPVLHYGWD